MKTLTQIKKAQAKLDKELNELQSTCNHNLHGPYVGISGVAESDGTSWEVKFCKGCDKNWGKIQSEKNWSW